jgi:hypothetical protein
MISEDLRIGNYYSYNGNNVTIAGFVHPFIHLEYDNGETTICNIDDNQLKPIQLTREILAKNNYRLYTFEIHGYEFSLKDNKNGTFTPYIDDSLCEKCFFSKEISYVHELQNLLYAVGCEDYLSI